VWTSDFPSVITANTTVKWRDGAATVPFNTTATEGDGWALTYYLRTNTASEGATVTGSSWNGSGWEFTIASSVTTNFDAGEWFWTAIVSKGSESFQLARGEFTVKQALAYTGGSPAAIDDRTQNEIDLDNVTAAIRAIISDKAASYTIGNRTFTRLNLNDLRMRESQLKAIVVREKKASLIAQGLGNPHNLFVRF